MIREEIVDRLVCSKYIFGSGVEILDRGAPYASGLAVLAFQDAVEMTLRAIAEHVHAQIKESIPFNQLIDEIDKIGPHKLTHRTALNQLNKARVNFKHLGLAPRDEDVVKFRRDLEGFFPNATNAFLGIDFETLSLVSLVRHRRTRNWLENSEAMLRDDEYQKCAVASAVAVQVFLRNRRLSDGDSYLRRMRPRSPDSIEAARVVKNVVEEVERQLDMVHEQLDLIGSGLSYYDFKRFKDLTPDIMLPEAGPPIISSGASYQPTYEQALFCTSFARNLALKMQGQYLRDTFTRQSSKQRFRATKATEVLVYPPINDQREVLEELPIGAVVDGYSHSFERAGYAAVFYQGECAYVPLDAVEPLIAENQ